MKVILEAQHAVGHPEPRGIGHYSINLIQALVHRRAFDYALTYFDYMREVQNNTRAEKFFGKYNVPIYECNKLDYRIASRDDNVWNEKSYNEWTSTQGDIYHFMNPVSIPVRLDGRIVVTVHDVSWMAHPDMISKHTMPLFTLGLDRIERIQPNIIADSKSAREQLLCYSSIPQELIHVIYQSYDETNLYPEKTSVSKIVDGEYFLYVGAFAPNKNLVRIVEAFNIIAAKHKDLKLILAGKPAWDDPSGTYDCINSSPFSQRIELPGYVGTDTKRKLLSNAMCFVFPSICEGFGIPVLEAMACGCPVITADNTSLPEVGGNAAIYVNAYDTEQLAYEMERVVSSESLRKDMIKRGFLQSKKFSWDKCAEQVENVYREIGAQK